MTVPDVLPRTAYRVAEVAESLGLSKAAVYRLCQSGGLGCIRSGRSVLIPAEALAAFKADNS